MSQAAAKIPKDGHCISSLAEEVEALLGTDAWQCYGFWRWVVRPGDNRRQPARRRVYYDTTNQRRPPVQIRGYDQPKYWWPLEPLKRNAPVSPRIAEPEIEPVQLPIEQRIATAWKVDRALPDRERGQLRVRANWPETGYEPGDYPPEAVTRWRPSPAELSDCMVVMRWVAKLVAIERRVLRLKALGLTYRTIAEEISRDEKAAKRIYREAVANVVRLAGTERGGPADKRSLGHGRAEQVSHGGAGPANRSSLALPAGRPRQRAARRSA